MLILSKVTGINLSQVFVSLYYYLSRRVSEAAFFRVNQLLILPQNSFSVIGMAIIAPTNT